MIRVSEAWKTAQRGFLAPEGYVEISYHITEEGLQDNAAISSNDQAVISNLTNVLASADFDSGAWSEKFATTELNLWSLDGTRKIRATGQTTDGYVSGALDTGSVRITLPEVFTGTIPGITIFFSEEYDECAEIFTITAYNGSTVVSTFTVVGNTEKRRVVETELTNFDSVEVVVHKWGLPYHRSRIERIALGVVAVFTKDDITGYAHELRGCLSSGELPKNSIEFALDNTSGRWNLGNPVGYEKYISERQRLTVRYGFDVNGTREWIPAGRFYLSEWRTPANGLEASFVARDMLEFMLDEIYTGPKTGSLYEIANAAFEQVGMFTMFIWEGLNLLTASFTEDYTLGEVIQMCANAACCVLFPDNYGNLSIERYPFRKQDEEYRIPLNLSYSYPEYELSKPLRGVRVGYGENHYNLAVSKNGEIQTMDNPFISTEAQAAEIADWVRGNLVTRKHISGEFRVDPRVELYDTVTVEVKGFGVETLVVTNIRYTFTGAFRATYSGYVPEVVT